MWRFGNTNHQLMDCFHPARGRRGLDPFDQSSRLPFSNALRVSIRIVDNGVPLPPSPHWRYGVGSGCDCGEKDRGEGAWDLVLNDFPISGTAMAFASGIKTLRAEADRPVPPRRDTQQISTRKQPSPSLRLLFVPAGTPDHRPPIHRWVHKPLAASSPGRGDRNLSSGPPPTARDHGDRQLLSSRTGLIGSSGTLSHR